MDGWTMQGLLSSAQNTVSKVKTDLTTNVKVVLPPVPATCRPPRAMTGLAVSPQDAFNKKDVRPEVVEEAEVIVEEAIHGISTGLDLIAAAISEASPMEQAKQGREAMMKQGREAVIHRPPRCLHFLHSTAASNLSLSPLGMPCMLTPPHSSTCSFLCRAPGFAGPAHITIENGRCRLARVSSRE